MINDNAAADRDYLFFSDDNKRWFDLEPNLTCGSKKLSLRTQLSLHVISANAEAIKPHYTESGPMHYKPQYINQLRVLRFLHFRNTC